MVSPQPGHTKGGIFMEKYGAIQVRFGKVILLCKSEKLSQSCHLLVSLSQTAFSSFIFGRAFRPNIKEEKAVWLRETNHLLHELHTVSISGLATNQK